MGSNGIKSSLIPAATSSLVSVLIMVHVISCGQLSAVMVITVWTQSLFSSSDTGLPPLLVLPSGKAFPHSSNPGTHPSGSAPYPFSVAHPVKAKHVSSPGHSGSSPDGQRFLHVVVTSSHDVPQKNPDCTSVNGGEVCICREFGLRIVDRYMKTEELEIIIAKTRIPLPSSLSPSHLQMKAFSNLHFNSTYYKLTGLTVGPELPFFVGPIVGTRVGRTVGASVRASQLVPK